MPDLSSILGAIGILIGIAVPSYIAYRVASGAAKKVDVELLETSYKKLQKTYEDVNARLNNELEAERLARRADRMSCESQIADLQRQLTALLSKLPEPGVASKVIIVGAEITKDADGKVINPVPALIVGPLPLPMTAAEAQAAREEMEKE